MPFTPGPDFGKASADELQAKGILESHEHAEKVRPGWTEDAVRFVGRYAEMKGEPFLIEDARAWAYDVGLNEPPSLSSWGAVPRRAAALGLIHHTGQMRQTKSPGGHKDEKVLWAPGEGTTSAPHSRRDVLAEVNGLKETADQFRKEGRTYVHEQLLRVARILENLAPRT